MNGFYKFHKIFTYRSQTDETQFWLMMLGGMIAAIVFAVFFNLSFESAQFLVISKRWESVTELVHDETDRDYVCDFEGKCEWKTDTDTVVDEQVILSGQGLDPIVYHTGFVPKGEQYIRYRLSTNVELEYEGTAVTYRPNQGDYERLPLGGWCVGEIGWFDVVRHVRCGGR